MRKSGILSKAVPALLLTVTACGTAAQAASYTMHRDPNCGCCEEWADHARTGLDADIVTRNETDMNAVKDRLGVPADLRSCHTMVVDGYVIEGHVPASAVTRLLEERPSGVLGLAVPGMPIGSPGMEMGDRSQPYEVIAFGTSGARVFESHE
ncbi:MAG: DUF411 domain-containing protein [Pacificimonas sp.]